MRQDRYRRDRNERGDETIFDRGRRSLVANEILAFGSHVHIFFSCALPNLRGRPSVSLCTLEREFEPILNGGREKPHGSPNAGRHGERNASFVALSRIEACCCEYITLSV